ncbi:MAG: DUF4421 family protein [Flavicella sp.]
MASKHLDTILFDPDIHHWSVRLIAGVKNYKFSLGDRYEYTANNPEVFGVGMANRYLAVDATLNVTLGEKYPTKRLDVAFVYVKRKNLVEGFFQHYKGFSVRDKLHSSEGFDGDLRSFTSGLRYLYLFNHKDFSFGVMKAGMYRPKKTSFRFGMGGFVLVNNQHVPLENSLLSHQGTQIPTTSFRTIRGTALGVQVGIAGLFSLPFKTFAALNIQPGLGLMNKKISLRDLNYTPKNPWISQMAISGLIGRNFEDFYGNISLVYGHYAADFDRQNHLKLTYLTWKLSIGYRLDSYLSKKKKARFASI